MQPASRRVCRFYNIIVGEPGVAEPKKASGRAIAAPHFSLQGFGHSGESIEIRACARDLRSLADPEHFCASQHCPKFGESYPGVVYLDPRIIAIHSPRIPERRDLGIACASNG
jgi:hypothetical protein